VAVSDSIAITESFVEDAVNKGSSSSSKIFSGGTAAGAVSGIGFDSVKFLFNLT